MKYIQVPAPIALIHKPSGKPLSKEGADGEPADPVTFHQFLCRFVLPDDRMGASYAAQRAAFKLDEAFSSAAPGAWVAVDEQHLTILLGILLEPPTQMIQGGGTQKLPMLGLPPAIGFQFIPMIEAVRNARDERPA